MPPLPTRRPKFMNAPAPTLSFVDQYGASRDALPGNALPWLSSLRETAIANFAGVGLPTPRAEAWKYTSLRPLEKLAFETVATETISIDRLPILLPHGQGGYRLVFVNGAFRNDLSTLDDVPDGVAIGSLAETLASNPQTLEAHLGRIAMDSAQPLLALNTAMMRDGLVLRIGPGVDLPTPIEVIFIGAAPDTPRAFHPRDLIVLEPDSRATIIEHHAGFGTGGYFANSATEVLVGAGAALHHYKVQAEDADAFHVATSHVRLDRDAIYDGFTLSTGARLSRHEISVRLMGTGAECHLNGAYMLRGEQHCDITTAIEHEAPHTSSREVFKGVIDDTARAVFQGRIVVHPKAQKSDGHQLSKALLLSDRAEIDAKPELEIYADDVKCSHGATAGDLDHAALFYLRSRGIPEATARHLLIEAFLTDTIRRIAAEGLCPALMASVGAWLSHAASETHHE